VPKEAEFIVFDSTSRENELREKRWDKKLQKAYQKGAALFSRQ
jgi:NAD(P)H dehydrogenase (quinone)